MDVEAINTVTFIVNGKRYTVGGEYPIQTTLLDFLRKTEASTGTKECCFKGGCGICLVTVTMTDPATRKPKTCSVNSCCLHLYSCEGMVVTTIEGIGNTRSGIHPIQDRLATYDGAQCGYCSPGQVMNMYGLLKNKPRPVMKEVEDAFDTTICRCTGYRSILDAMKSFATDAPATLAGGVIDIEELDGTICCKSSQPCVEAPNGKPKHLQIVGDGYQWFRPADFGQLTNLLQRHSRSKYRLVLGNTAFGVYKELKVTNYEVLIDIRGVKELYGADLDDPFSVHFGANLSLTTVKETFESLSDPTVPYAKAFASHLGYVTSNGVRNLGSMAGNIMIKHQFREFVSDVFTLLETVRATLNIVDSLGRNKNYTMQEFLSLDMTGRVILTIQLPKNSNKNITIRTFRTSHRKQVCFSDVVSGYNFQINASQDYLIETKPTIVVQGISSSLVHATNAENYLANKRLSDPAVVKEAILQLSKDLKVTFEGLGLSSSSYRIAVAIGHFYKFVLDICKSKVDPRYVSGGHELERAVMSSTHDYGSPNPETFPASKPLMKLTAKNLTTGEVKFINDLPTPQGQLYAAVLLSTQGNCQIGTIDPSDALNLPGVVTFIRAADIPGQNNWRPSSIYAPYITEILSSGKVEHAGQPLGIIVTESANTAKEALKAVKVTYTDIKPVIVDVMDAIEQKSFLNKLGPYTKGTAEAALASAPHRVKGSARTQGQYHFHMENQAAVATPTDLGGMDVFATTQWVDVTHEAVAQCLGIPQSSVTIEVQRLGGAFGAKLLYNLPVAAMTSIAAYKTQKSVKMYMDLETNMQFQGTRMCYYYDYEVGFDNDGKLLAIVATGYGDGGCMDQYELNEHTYNFIDGGYFCPNWSWTVQVCKTHKPGITFMRAPGSAAAIFAMENIIDHVATFLKKDHLEVRKLNLFSNGMKTLSGAVIENSLARDVAKQLETDFKYQDRKKQVEEFNKANRWRKRGLHVMLDRYFWMYTKLRHNTSVVICHGDASVVIAHGGIDMGQGINTKAIQTCAYKLGIPMDKIRVAKSSSVMNSNSDYTGGSSTSDLICNGIIQCCNELNKRMANSRASLKDPTWEKVVGKAYTDGVNLTCQYWPDKLQDSYNTYSACCSEVELDVLTGQYQISQVDYVYDCGISLNPELDLGQLEGAFAQGCGMFLLESTKQDPKTGKSITDGTNTYMIPLAKDLPIKMNVKFLRNAPNPAGVLGCKAIGEAPVSVGACPMFALKRAIEAARAETGVDGWFPLYAPATVESIQQACLNDPSKYTLQGEVAEQQVSGSCQTS